MLNLSIKRLNKIETETALNLVWKVFLEYEAPDYTQEGIDEFYKSMHDENYLAMLYYPLLQIGYKNDIM